MRGLREKPGVAFALLWIAVSLSGGCRPAAESAAPSLDEALALYEDGRPREARSAALSIAKEGSFSGEERRRLAAFLIGIGESAAALGLFDDEAEKPSRAERELIAKALLKTGRVDDAARLVAELVREGPSAGTHLLRGVLSDLGGANEEAVAALKEARRLDPADDEAWAWLGWALHRGGASGEGIAVMREGLRRLPESWIIRANLSGVLFRTSPDNRVTLEEVVELCEYVAKRHPFDRASRSRLGVAHSRLGDDLRAIPVLLELTQEFPRIASFWADLGVAQVGAGRDGAAVKSLENASRLEPGNAAILLNLGTAHLANAESVKHREESLRRALEAFDEVRRLAPGHPGGMCGRARCLVKLRPTDNDAAKEARRLYEEALEIDDKNFEALLNVALLYYDLAVKEPAGTEWNQKALDRFRRAALVRPVREWDAGAQRAFADLERK